MIRGEDLEQLAQLEEAVGGLYGLLGERFAGSAPVAEFWRRLARDEAGHAAVLRAFSEENLPLEGAETSADDPFQVEQSLRHIDRLRRRAEEIEVSLEGALALAYGIEHSLAERHVRVQSAAGGLRRLFEQLASADDEHLARLRAFAAGRGVFLPAGR
jgi:rubrerythrin